MAGFLLHKKTGSEGFAVVAALGHVLGHAGHGEAGFAGHGLFLRN